MREVDSFEIEGYLLGSEQPKKLVVHYARTKTKNKILRVVDPHNRDVLLLLSPVTLDNVEERVHAS